MHRPSISRVLTGAVFVLSALAACASPDDGQRPGAPPPVSAPRDGTLRASVALDGEVFTADEAPVVAVTIVNDGDAPAQVLAWYVQDDELAAPLVTVWRDGAPVGYRGPLVKRRAPAADDFVTLAPGGAVTRRIDLAASYDLSRSGDYTVRVEVASADLRGVDAGGRYLVSDERALWAEGRGASARVTVASATFNRCTTTQQAQLDDAVGVATTMSSQAAAYLAGAPSATPRYVTWFGAFSTAGWNTAAGHFAVIASAFANQPLSFDCKCKQKNVYAYVNTGAPYLIHLCGAFWTAPLSGTDSKGGTLVHEMSHFNVTAGTDDWAYGQTACRSLALSDPTRALDNADSHEYFAENTPAQP